MRQITKFELGQALWQCWEHRDDLITLVDSATHETHCGLLQSITRESGDGHSFNVVLLYKNKYKTIFVRTVD